MLEPKRFRAYTGAMKTAKLVALIIGLQMIAMAQSAFPNVRIENYSWHDQMWENSKAAFSVELRNLESKTITEVHWDYLLIDSARQQVYDHFKFITDDKKIEPGKKVKLIKRISYHETPDHIGARVVIVKLVFADGTVWNAKPD